MFTPSSHRLALLKAFNLKQANIPFQEGTRKIKQMLHQTDRMFRFLDLPGELRNKIYQSVVEGSYLAIDSRFNTKLFTAFSGTHKPLPLSLLQACRQVRSELSTFLQGYEEELPALHGYIRDYKFGSFLDYLRPCSSTGQSTTIYLYLALTEHGNEAWDEFEQWMQAIYCDDVANTEDNALPQKYSIHDVEYIVELVPDTASLHRRQDYLVHELINEIYTSNFSCALVAMNFGRDLRVVEDTWAIDEDIRTAWDPIMHCDRDVWETIQAEDIKYGRCRPLLNRKSFAPPNEEGKDPTRRKLFGERRWKTGKASTSVGLDLGNLSDDLLLKLKI